MDKTAILRFFQQARAADAPFWGIGVDEKSLPSAVAAGASWAVCNHTAAFARDIPSSAIGLLPYADANSDVLAKGPFLNAPIPVLAALFAGDQFRIPERLLRDAARAGYAGIENFPTTGLAEGKFREQLDDSEMGYRAEINLIRAAAAMGFFTSALVFTPEQAEEMTRAGADMLAFHPGLNADGEHRSWSPAARERFQAIAQTAQRLNPDIIMVRTSHSREEWPPQRFADSVGVRYDDNFPKNPAGQRNIP